MYKRQHYVLGSVMGPHPFPTIVRDFQAVISKEIKEQILEKEDVYKRQVYTLVLDRNDNSVKGGLFCVPDRS